MDGQRDRPKEPAMNALNLDGRRFVPIENAEGLSGLETIFEYRVSAGIITGWYSGGQIREGRMVGVTIANDKIRLLFQCITGDLHLRAGQSEGRLWRDPSGRLIIDFSWQWLSERGGGRSRHIEISGARRPDY
jgi:hypothetical protein